MASVVPRTKMISLVDLALMKRTHLLARAFIGGGGQFAQVMHAAVHVGVVVS